MAMQEKQLGQRRDNDTLTHSIYSPAAGVTAIVKSIVVCNTSASEATFSLFIDDDGTTYDESTTLFPDISLDAKSTVQIDTYYTMNDPTGNLAYQQGSPNAITITVFGVEITA